MIAPPSRRCVVCDEEKPEDEFHVKSRETRRDGTVRITRGTTCRVCWNRAQAAETKRRAEFRAEVRAKRKQEFAPEGTDFTLVAEQILFDGRPYTELSLAERALSYAYARELCRRYSVEPRARELDAAPWSLAQERAAHYVATTAYAAIPWSAGRSTYRNTPKEDA